MYIKVKLLFCNSGVLVPSEYGAISYIMWIFLWVYIGSLPGQQLSPGVMEHYVTQRKLGTA